MNYLISALDEACTDDSNAANSTIVKQYALEIGSKLGSERNKRQEKVYQMLLKHQLIEKMTGN